LQKCELASYPQICLISFDAAPEKILEARSYPQRARSNSNPLIFLNLTCTNEITSTQNPNIYKNSKPQNPSCKTSVRKIYKPLQKCELTSDLQICPISFDVSPKKIYKPSQKCELASDLQICPISFDVGPEKILETRSCPQGPRSSSNPKNLLESHMHK